MDPRIQQLIDAGMQFPSGVTDDMIERVNSISNDPPEFQWDQFVASVQTACANQEPIVLQFIAFQTRNAVE